MINGIINVYKEKDYTSHDVVAKLRGILQQKKIGHTGTLDPQAEGVLPVCLGKATKVCDLLTDKDKEYQAVLLLGQTTDTQDTTGTLLTQKNVTCTKVQVKEALKGFIGKYMQIPPMYSALKVNGKKLCDLARAGIEVERKPREVTIFSIEILDISLPRIRMLVHCSKGTYIRTLCQDIGEKLGCGGCMESLIRTRVAEFQQEDAWTLGQIQEHVQKIRQEHINLSGELLKDMIRPTDSVFLAYPKATVKEMFYKMLYNGNSLELEWLETCETQNLEIPLRIYDIEGHFIGIYQFNRKHENLKPIKIFME
ncbi:MAG: tRNA pseudouridine(55) synthase TruB [Lachnospiraceae bacterium]